MSFTRRLALILGGIFGAAKAEPEKLTEEEFFDILCKGAQKEVPTEKPPAFAPAPTSDEPSTELVERMAKAGFEAFAMSTRTTGFVWSMAGEGRKEAERSVGRAVYALIAADHAAQVKRVRELESENAKALASVAGLENRIVDIGHGLNRVDPDHVARPCSPDVAAVQVVAEKVATIQCLRAEVARLSAPCPADGMSDREVSINISTALYHNNDGWADHEAGGAAARALFGRPAR